MENKTKTPPARVVEMNTLEMYEFGEKEAKEVNAWQKGTISNGVATIEHSSYGGTSCSLLGAYIFKGAVRDANHKVVGITPDELQKVIAAITRPDFAYARKMSYGGLNFYASDPESPSGVRACGGCPEEYAFLLEIFKKVAPLSPTEGR